MKVDQLDRKQLFHQHKHQDKQCISLSATYSQALTNLKDILTKHWHILQANQSCEKTFITFSAKSLALIPFIITKNLKKLKITIIQESVSHVLQHLASAVNNLF